ncbi:hypothetical protein L1049_004742 [Liquidambar formosana]|uniref:Peptidase A1 domain-containing protein n=1 Tax=Liquidambar formosana TaxID=63359 RepID=A0AAP0RUB2_LIQFO
MAKTTTLLFLYFLSSLLLLGCVAGKPNGLTLRLIHRDSPESPIYPGNLTSAQRIQRLVDQSNARAHYLSSILSKTNTSQSVYPSIIRPLVAIQAQLLYMVEIGIGTLVGSPSYMSYYLLLDTGAELSWTQCEGCMEPGRHCYPQSEPYFPNGRSHSYQPLPCNGHPLCTPNECIGAYCSFDLRYADGDSVLGILASETLTLSSNTRGRKESLRIVFGCGIDNRLQTFGNRSSNKIAGIMGLGWGARSFVRQINLVTGGAFSYCLTYGVQGSTTYLRFGADIVRRGSLHMTPLFQIGNEKAYHVNFEGISVNGTRLDIKKNEFVGRSVYNSNDWIIDSGAAVTHIFRPNYETLEAALVEIFKGSTNIRRIAGLAGFNLCYVRLRRQGFRNLPGIIIHFENADFDVRPEAAFVLGEIPSSRQEYFCLAMNPSNSFSILGAYQQTNQRIIYDTRGKALYFGPEDCSHFP